MTYVDSTPTIDDKMVSTICSRVVELRELNQPGWRSRQRTRDIMNGGPGAIRALLNKASASEESAPFANLMLSANDRLAQKLGRPPTIRKEPPATQDSDAAHKRADKLARIVEAMDVVSKMMMLLPQIGRWLPGYGFAPFVVRHGYSRDGAPYPMVDLRDPFSAFPGEWGVAQQPDDIAFGRTITKAALAAQYPEHRSKIMGNNTSSRGGVLLDNGGVARPNRAGWENQSGAGVDIYEYYNRDGCWWVAPALNLLLSHVPNLMSRPQFYVMKRFSFDALTGQHDHYVGLLAAMARMNLLLVIATEDAVMSETNVYGETVQGDQYHTGRGAVNWLSPGTRVDKPGTNVPMQAFQFLNTFERQLRIVGSYPVTDDSISPNSFVTGRGLEELSASNDLHVREFQTVIADGMQEIDSLRLEWDETYYPDRAKPMAGVRSGTPFSETYTPSKDIKGDYTIRRVYGAMAGFDEPSKIATGLQLLAAEIIDDETLQENVDGLENLGEIRKRIDAGKARKVIDQVLLAKAGQGDAQAMAAAIGMLPDGEHKTLLTNIFLNQQPPPDQQAPPGMPQPSIPPDTFSALARMGTNAAGAPNVKMDTSVQHQQVA